MADLRKRLERLARIARRQGWQVDTTRGGHLRWRPPGGGRAIYSSSTPSDYRGLRNLVAHLKRAGLNLEG